MTIDKNPILVVKIGGTEGVDFSAVCEDAAALVKSGQKLVLVHGGSAEATALGKALGTPPKFITSPSGFTSRYTDRGTLEVFFMAVNGKINSSLTEKMNRLGVKAFGLSGIDGGWLAAERKTAIQSIENGKRKLIRDDYTGRITSVDPTVLSTLLDLGFLPIVSPLAAGLEGEALNVDADRAAAGVAAALHAETLILLTAVPGLLRQFPDESSLISVLKRADLPQALEIAQGRMKKKILGAQEALDGGVGRVILADGRCEASITRALAGHGTLIA